jgi:hypothetical protein
MPALGVCLGCQLMNVHRGGSLVQFLPEVPRDNALEHRHLGDDAYRHDVRVEPGTVLAAAVGRDRITVNSRHKQAVDGRPRAAGERLLARRLDRGGRGPDPAAVPGRPVAPGEPDRRHARAPGPVPAAGQYGDGSKEGRQ